MYTPRQVDAYLFLSRRRVKRESALALSIAASGSRGEPREVKKLIGTWNKAEPE